MTILGLLALMAWERSSAADAPMQIILVEPAMVTEVPEWKKDGFKGVAVVLDQDGADYRTVAKRVADAGLDLYWWVEVGRNPKLATAHPKWMASLGSHEDWLKRFPGVAQPAVDEVAKAYPWVPISYKEAFDAHLQRIEGSLKRVPDGAKGLLLNDLQGGPSSCGCGNVLCRWAIDYHVRPTATKLEGDYTAAKFVAEVRKRAGKQAVIPVWTTECEEVDLPANKRAGKAGTGLCGTVPCAKGGCPESFSGQWSALLSMHDGPVGLLALHTALQRTQPPLTGAEWVTNAIAYPNQTVPAYKGKTITEDRLWVVVEESAREVAAKAGVGAVIVARTKIDQSFEPRVVSTK